MNRFQKESEKKNLYYPGMFDFIKGLAMISIVMAHAKTGMVKPLSESTAVVMSYIDIFTHILSFRSSAMLMFLMVSGYGFRKIKDNWKCIKKQVQLLIKPFIIVACITILVHFVVHYAVLRYLPGSIQATICVAAGYLLGSAASFYIGEMTTCSVGAVWFLLMLFFSWISLNFIVTKVKEVNVPWVILIIFVIGRMLCFLPTIPYCLVQGVIGIPYLYLGWVIKQNELLTKKFPFWAWMIMGVLAFVAIGFGGIDLANANLEYGFLDLIDNGCLAFLVMWLGLRINQFNIPLKNNISMIGRYSLWIMCLHTIEQISLPWYLLYERLNLEDYWVYIMILAIKAVLIYAGYRFLIWNTQRKMQKKREARKRRHAS